nr:MAG TPA: hypothetical protein [Bacteriophage sp.]
MDFCCKTDYFLPILIAIPVRIPKTSITSITGQIRIASVITLFSYLSASSPRIATQTPAITVPATKYMNTNHRILKIMNSPLCRKILDAFREHLVHYFQRCDFLVRRFNLILVILHHYGVCNAVRLPAFQRLYGLICRDCIFTHATAEIAVTGLADVRQSTMLGALIATILGHCELTMRFCHLLILCHRCHLLFTSQFPLHLHFP